MIGSILLFVLLQTLTKSSKMASVVVLRNSFPMSLWIPSAALKVWPLWKKLIATDSGPHLLTSCAIPGKDTNFYFGCHNCLPKSKHCCLCIHAERLMQCPGFTAGDGFMSKYTTVRWPWYLWSKCLIKGYKTTLVVRLVKKVLDLEWYYDDWYEVEYIPPCVWHVQYILRNYFLVMIGAHKMILVAKAIFTLALCRSRKFFSVWKHFIMPWM